MEKNNEEAAVLVAQTGPLNGQRWPIKSSAIVGREATCEIVVPDRQVSRHHARVSLTDQGYQLEDLGSKNGTHYNGQPLETPVLLRDGDIIQIALAQQFIFLSSDATVPLDADEIDFQALLPVQKQASQPRTRLRLEKRSRRVWIGDQEVVP